MQITQMLRKRSSLWNWSILALVSAAFSFVLVQCNVPGALLLGPMMAGVLVAVCGAELKVLPLAFAFSQGIVGCMIAGMLSVWLSQKVFGNLPVFVFGVFSIIVITILLGWIMIRMHLLPESTVVWGLSPGAATAMTVMADEYGADSQLVALMQYLRCFVVVASASIVARMFGAGVHGGASNATYFGHIEWLSLVQTVGLIVLSILLTRRFHVQAGAMLLPMVGGILLIHYDLMKIELPTWLLFFGYAFIGWKIGLGFSLPLLLHAAKLLPRILICIILLVAMCGGIGTILIFAAGVDPLSAYLATSPGGLDTVAIIASTSHGNISFVMGMQLMRFAATVVCGPALAKHFARRSPPVSLP